MPYKSFLQYRIEAEPVIEVLRTCVVYESYLAIIAIAMFVERGALALFGPSLVGLFSPVSPAKSVKHISKGFLREPINTTGHTKNPVALRPASGTFTGCPHA